MDTHTCRFINATDLSFRYSLFGIEDMEDNLDYLDSNGDRYPQELYAIDFTQFELPPLRTSSLHYFPANTGYKHSYDTFYGSVQFDTPIVGMRRLNSLSNLRETLSRYLKNLLSTGSLHIQHKDQHISIVDSDGAIQAAIYAEKDHTDGLRLEVIVPTDPTFENETRYDDAIFASELWVLLNDFALNIDTYVNGSARALGKIAYHSAMPAQTFHIGIDKLQEDNRFSASLLRELDSLTRLVAHESFVADNGNLIHLDSDVELAEIHRILASYSDDAITEITRRAAISAYRRPDRTLGNEVITSAIRAQDAISQILD